MDHIFDSIHISDMATTATGVFSSLSNLVAFIFGMLLAFWTIEIIINIFTPTRHRKNEGYSSGEYMASLPDMKEDDIKYYKSDKYMGNNNNFDDEDDDDFAY